MGYETGAEEGLNVRIGELAQQAGVAVETLRYYEQQGLLAKPARSAANFRIYTAQHVEQLAFIRQCRLLDLSLAEIRVLLGYKAAPEQACGEVNRLLDRHIINVQERIQELQALETHLLRLRERCTTEQAAMECGILQELSQPLAAAGMPCQLGCEQACAVHNVSAGTQQPKYLK